MTVCNRIFFSGHLFSKNKPVLVYFCRDKYIKTQTYVNPLLWDDKKECIKSLAICNEEMRQKVTREVNWAYKTKVIDTFSFEGFQMPSQNAHACELRSGTPQVQTA